MNEPREGDCPDYYAEFDGRLRCIDVVSRGCVLFLLLVFLSGCGFIVRKELTGAEYTGNKPAMMERLLGVYYDTPKHGVEHGPEWLGLPFAGHRPPRGKHGLTGLLGFRSGEPEGYSEYLDALENGEIER